MEEASDLLRGIAAHSTSALSHKPLRLPMLTWVDLPQLCRYAELTAVPEHRYRVRMAVPGGGAIAVVPEEIPTRDSAVALARALLDVDAALRESTGLLWSLEEFQHFSLRDANVGSAIRVVFDKFDVSYPCSLEEWEGLSMLPALLAATAVGSLAREYLLSGPTWSVPAPRDPVEEVLTALLLDQSVLPQATPREWVSDPVFMWGQLSALADKNLLSVARALCDPM